jgi:diguanylate cyclase (GGDEF)-like protein
MRSPLPASGGPPRLVLRFAVATALALALAAGAILLVVRHFDTVQAERSATSHARLIASSVLRASLELSDFARPVDAQRRAALDDLFARQVLNQGVLRATVYADDGTVTYSTDHRLIGSQADTRHIEEALNGTVRGDVTTLPSPTAGGKRTKVLRTYAPVAVPGGTGAVAIFHDYAPIARAAKATFLPVAGIFEAVLVILFVLLVPVLRKVTKRVRRQMEEIEYRALYDELTGLPNRTLFRDRIEDSITAASTKRPSFAVMLLDVDRFKDINDALGHDLGDLLLQEVGKRLAVLTEPTETLARLGGDEFGFLLPDASTEQAAAVAERIHHALEAPFALRGLPVEIAVSAGVAVYPDHGEDVEALLQHADVALYFAKDAHLGTALYSADQDTSDATKLALASELRRAIGDGELLVHFQPQAELQNGQIVGAEALVRWQHPERGFISPGDFIPIAERTGLIKPLSRYVLRAALRQCAVWNAAGLDLRVSVNVTIPDLLDLEFPERVAALLDETDVRPEQLELEITESTILADPFRVRAVLTSLNEMGLRFAIDDFGTGYSSLAYLRRLPVQTIKIDRSFVMGMCEDANDATIVRSTIDLGRNLGLEVVAEGVETQEVWAELRALGCSLAQGYLISRPSPAEELEPLFDERARPAGAAVEAGLVRL